MITQEQQDLLASVNQRTARMAELPANLDRAEKVVAVTYDFSADGGATGTIDLDYTVEEDAVVTKVLSHELTTCTSAGSATVTLKSGSTALTGAIAFDSGFTGLDNQALASSADAIAVSADDVLKVTIGTAALTAGKVRFYVYMLPQRDM